MGTVIGLFQLTLCTLLNVLETVTGQRRGQERDAGRASRLEDVGGGYNVEAISNSALAVVKVLLGDAPPEIQPMVASEAATETVWQVAMEQSKYWKSVNPKACEPREGTVLYVLCENWIS